MRLCEDLQEEIIESFKEVLDAYNQLSDACRIFSARCENSKDLKFTSNYLVDFCDEELWEKLKDTKEEILDVYYPIDFGDDEDDSTRAGQIYRDSKEAREAVFK